MMLKKVALLTIGMLYLCLLHATAQPTQIKQVAPPFWWTDMENPNLQILVHGDNIAKFKVSVKHKGVKVKEVHRLENADYLFVDLYIDKKTQPDTLVLLFKKGKQLFTHNYELRKRKGFDGRISGLDGSDVIYLIMPDRFVNADRANDVDMRLKDRWINRDSAYYRHGGDLQGVISKLDYLQSLGITALWLNPVLINDQPGDSYHGYAATDHFEVDPRLGGMTAYLQLVEQCHARGMKIVMDVNHNHTGDQHWFIKDKPSEDWVHQHEEFTRTHYRAPTVFDPYASEADKRTLKEGWFSNHLPDLNQDNPFLANYLIQNSIWWIEHAGVDAFHLNTYAFSEDNFLEKWGEAIYNEYPQFSSFGETWVEGAPSQAYFHGKNNFKNDFKSNLAGVTDFQLYYAVTQALNEPFGWSEGISRLYYTLTKDYLYEDASQNVVFLDNHDLPRFFNSVGQDIKKYKMGMSFAMTTRGIPSLNYGTEVLLGNSTYGDSRTDFIGGWPSDTISKFSNKGRTALENEAFKYTKKLINWRKHCKVIHEGKLMQFIPEDGLYVYFRYTDNDAVMVVMNSNKFEVLLDTEKYNERLAGYNTARDVETGKLVTDLQQLRIPAMSTLILDMEEQEEAPVVSEEEEGY